MTNRTTIVATLAAALAMTTTVSAREAIVGLSPLQTPDALQGQVERVIQHLLETVEPGETALLFDAANVRLIGSFVVPDKAAYANPRAKLQANKALLADLKRFIDGAKPMPGREAHIDMPGLLRTISQNYPADHDRALIVIGSPIFHDPKAPSVSMQDGRVPNDGHLGASIGASPFGTAGLAGSLEGTDVYFGLAGGDDWQVSMEHAFHVERFWTLSAEGHGGTMQYFGDDWETLFRLSASDGPDRRHSDPLVLTDKLEMLQFAPDNAEVPDIYGADVTAAPPPEPIWRAAVDPTFGLTWDCLSCDLDLYVKIHPDAPAIYFGRPTTDDGRLYKDHQNAPANGFETVAIEGAVVDLEQARVAVNFYGGNASGRAVTGELRIAIGDAVWAAPFTIEAATGNAGRDADAVMQGRAAPDEHWFVFETVTMIAEQ